MNRLNILFHSSVHRGYGYVTTSLTVKEKESNSLSNISEELSMSTETLYRSFQNPCIHSSMKVKRYIIKFALIVISAQSIPFLLRHICIWLIFCRQPKYLLKQKFMATRLRQIFSSVHTSL